jgi:hypothetical protein
MWIVGVSIIKLAFSVRLLPEGSRAYGLKVATERASCDLLVWMLKGREAAEEVPSWPERSKARVDRCWMDPLSTRSRWTGRIYLDLREGAREVGKRL